MLPGSSWPFNFDVLAQVVTLHVTDVGKVLFLASTAMNMEACLRAPSHENVVRLSD